MRVAETVAATVVFVPLSPEKSGGKHKNFSGFWNRNIKYPYTYRLTEVFLPEVALPPVPPLKRGHTPATPGLCLAQDKNY